MSSTKVVIMRQMYLSSLIILCLAIAGCSRYQVATWPDTTAVNSEFESTVEVESGQKVRATLKSGEVLRGELIELSDSQLSIESQPEQGDSVRMIIQAEDVAVLELEQGASSGTVLVGAIVVVGLGYAVVQGIQGWSLY